MTALSVELDQRAGQLERLRGQGGIHRRILAQLRATRVARSLRQS
jgi:hypothetical protein